jgi:hypothetical protein
MRKFIIITKNVMFHVYYLIECDRGHLTELFLVRAVYDLNETLPPPSPLADGATAGILPAAAMAAPAVARW